MQAWMMSPCRSTLQPYQKVTASVTALVTAFAMSGPLLAFFVGELELRERAHAVEVVRILMRLDLLRQPAAAERSHARGAHHHARIDGVGTRGHAHTAPSAHRDPAEGRFAAALAAQHREHAGHDLF